jgi:hypothetical protein
VDKVDRIDVRAEYAVVDLDLPRYVVQREKAAEGGLEVLARVRPKDKDLMGWAEVGNIVNPNVVPEPFEAATAACIDLQDGA